MIDLTGTGVALITPMKNDGSLDLEGLQKTTQHVAQGVDYVVALGTTGESATLSGKEKREVVSRVAETLDGSKPLVLGLGGNDTHKILEEIKQTDFSGISAILSVSPYYNKPSQSGLLAHYLKIADASPVPVILYNVPGRTGGNISAATTLQLADHPNIIATKEASGNVEQCMAIARDMPSGFQLLSGDDLLTPSLVSIGATGVISVLANAWPREFSAMVRHCLDHQFAAAEAFWKRWIPLNPLLYEEGNPVGIKAVMEDLGICGAAVRLPLVAASPELRQRIRNLLNQDI